MRLWYDCDLFPGLCAEQSQQRRRELSRRSEQNLGFGSLQGRRLTPGDADGTSHKLVRFLVYFYQHYGFCKRLAGLQQQPAPNLRRVRLAELTGKLEQVHAYAMGSVPEQMSQQLSSFLFCGHKISHGAEAGDRRSRWKGTRGPRITSVRRAEASSISK